MTDLCMSYCRCQTSQQQCQPHHEKKETNLPLHPFSACPTARLSASKSVHVLQCPATAGVQRLKVKQKAIRTLGAAPAQQPSPPVWFYG